jgi:hypothetical protein
VASAGHTFKKHGLTVNAEGLISSKNASKLFQVREQIPGSESNSQGLNLIISTKYNLDRLMLSVFLAGSSVSQLKKCQNIPQFIEVKVK